jgi:hypothetical protein
MKHLFYAALSDIKTLVLPSYYHSLGEASRSAGPEST